LTLETPAKRLDVSYTTLRDKHERAPGVRRFLLPFAEPAPADLPDQEIPELTGGDWEKGRVLFNGKAACATCHSLRGEGVEVGPDLNNLIHRDYAGVLRDIVDPGAVINPDAIGYTVTQKNGQVTIGTRVGETEGELHLAQPGGLVAKIAKSAIARTEALPVSLMPAGMDQALTKEELRDLMTYLLRDRK
jgi:putative heme-binding domain-containing protein